MSQSLDVSILVDINILKYILLFYENIILIFFLVTQKMYIYNFKMYTLHNINLKCIDFERIMSYHSYDFERI